MFKLFNNITNTFNELKPILGYILVGVVIILLLGICVKYKGLTKILLPTIFAIILITGIVSSIELVKILDVESKEVGSAIHLQQDNFDSVSRFEFGVIELESNDNSIFKNTRSFESEHFDGTDKKYLLLVNDMPCDSVVTKAGSVEGVFNLNFYDTEGKVITTAKLKILIEYFDKETKVTTSIINTNYSVSYLNAYMEYHGVLIEVVE